ncbi:MAG: hypothetical protein ORN29_00840, partial [Rhodoferax sp.]|nr:hypothetical protein [Rhodoferax sp.]
RALTRNLPSSGCPYFAGAELLDSLAYALDRREMFRVRARNDELASYECDNRRICKASAVITTTFDGVATRRMWSNNDGVLLTEEPPNDAILTPNPPLRWERCSEHSTSAHE